jgi:hypothetical protein
LFGPTISTFQETIGIEIVYFIEKENQPGPGIGFQKPDQEHFKISHAFDFYPGGLVKKTFIHQAIIQFLEKVPGCGYLEKVYKNGINIDTLTLFFVLVFDLFEEGGFPDFPLAKNREIRIRFMNDRVQLFFSPDEHIAGYTLGITVW